MLGPTKRMLDKYKILVTKMVVDSHREPVVKKNLKLMLEWEVILEM